VLIGITVILDGRAACQLCALKTVVRRCGMLPPSSRVSKGFIGRDSQWSLDCSDEKYFVLSDGKEGV
jgi:hypothetical protein